MNTLNSESNNDATFLNCFWRSLMFKRISYLNKSDSVALFFKTCSIYSLIYILDSVLPLFLARNFQFNDIYATTVSIISKIFRNVVSMFLICFILNIFLANSFIRIVNLFMFSGVHILVFRIFVSIYFQCSNTALINRSEGSKKYNLLTQEGYVIIALYMFTPIISIFLLIRNIRALRKK